MSKVKIEGNASGTGTLTIAAPNTNSDYSVTLPEVTGGEFVVTDSSGNVGIGTTSPDSALHIQKAAFATLKLEQTNTTGTRICDIVGEQNGTQKWRLGKLSSSSDDFAVQVGTTERMRIDSSGNLKFNSGYGSAATAYGCRAWVNFNGTGTPAIRASGNVSSITDRGTGNYRVNISNALTDLNYAPNVNCEETAGGYNRSATVTSTNTSYTDVRTFNTGTNSLFDAEYVYVQVVR